MIIFKININFKNNFFFNLFFKKVISLLYYKLKLSLYQNKPINLEIIIIIKIYSAIVL